LKDIQVDPKTIFEMDENKLRFVEGVFIHRSPMFSSVNYQFWKIHMKISIK